MPLPPVTPEVDQVKVSPMKPEEGEKEQEPEIAGLETVMVVYGPQLLFSFDSVIVPAEFLFVLSAHTRSEYVPGDANVYGSLNVLAPPAASAAMSTGGTISVMVPPPFGALVTCMKLLKEVPVLPEPMFLIVELKVAATPTVAETGEMKSVSLMVRSGRNAHEFEILLQFPLVQR